ncbi:ATP-binding protein [Marinobacter sp. F3R11]|uniref:ATP-binding protein n=1 Tax=Marinobacter sp. F3R11 TaxID=2267231 RepID=UPI000DEA4BE0|nr:ATP-binding protein [Marinobacter sp. F3R11]RBW49159.1 histidine kinase [Marinobacter sp. F3R11]
MTLKRQLFVASLLMLLIPWAGLQFVLELDQALRQQALQQLQDQAERLAQTAGDLSLGLPVVASRAPSIYVENISSPLNLDGYSDDWPGYDEGEQFQPWQTAGYQDLPANNAGKPTMQWQAATDQRHLYLLIRVSNHQPIFFNPGTPDQLHDQLMIWLEPANGNLNPDKQSASWMIRTPAPGRVYATTGGPEYKPDYRVNGVWQPAGNGWQIELQLPKPPQGSRLGFAAQWQSSPESMLTSTSTDPLPILVERKPGLERQLTPGMSRGQIARLIEPAGWVIAQQSTPSRQPRPEFESLSPIQIVEHISLNALRALVRFYQPRPATLATDTNRLEMSSLQSEGLVRHADDSVWLMTTHPVFGGRTLVLEQSLDQLLTLSGSTLGSVIARSTIMIIGLTLVLLGYASWLSWRITRLQRAVSASIDQDGRVIGTIATVPGARARDELGQLQNHFAQMVDRLHGYNRYLESFSQRLSHELKTPVAVVRSSLENLPHSKTEEERSQYIGRAAAATERLRQILHGMSEATRLEQSFDHADKEVFDLAEVIGQATAAYQSLDEHHRFQYTGPASGVTLTGSPELIVQLLDKLVDNARDFTPPDGRIITGLAQTGNEICLSVFNEGSALPASQDTSIFSPFVSVREGGEEGHLGQGLLIVQLIADFHGGRIEAENEIQSSIEGVSFRVIIPTAHS